MSEVTPIWKTVHQSVRGTSHVEEDSPCQDASLCRVIEAAESVLLLSVVSDGAGSAEFSAVGSTLVCATLEKLIEEYVESDDIWCGIEECVPEWCRIIREKLIESASSLEVPLRELACTMLFSLVGDSRALFGQIGDGAMVFTTDEEFEMAFWPQSGEYANTTNFLTQEDYLSHVDFFVYEGAIIEFAAFTDGLERLILHFIDQTVHKPFLEPLFNALRLSEDPGSLGEPLMHFLDSENINLRTDDDKTLILATRRNVDQDDEPATT